MNKSAVLDSFIRDKQEKERTLITQIGNLKEQLEGLPNTKEAKNERGILVESYGQKQKELEDVSNTIRLLKEFPREHIDVIQEGVLFTLKDCDESCYNTYLFTQNGGGCYTEIFGQKISCVTGKAPVAAEVKGKKVGDRVTFRDKTLEIVFVQ